MYLSAQNASGFVKWILKILKSKSPISFDQEQRCYIWPVSYIFLSLIIFLSLFKKKKGKKKQKIKDAVTSSFYFY